MIEIVHQKTKLRIYAANTEKRTVAIQISKNTKNLSIGLSKLEFCALIKQLQFLVSEL